MAPAVLIRLRPSGPWRYGPGDGARDRIDIFYRSDRLYSAVTLAMRQLGLLEDWLDATARTASPVVAFSSLFPYQGDALFAPPPSTLWPPPASLVTGPTPAFLSKLRWKVARLVPLNLIESILVGQNVLADQWIPDVESGCLLRRDRPSSSPFRPATRSTIAVDRITQSAANIDSSACVEFEPGSGLWCVGRFANAGAESTWDGPVRAAFRLLADTGFGGRRSSGWGKAEPPEFQSGNWPNLAMPKLSRIAQGRNGSEKLEGDSSLFWLLSLYSPGMSDAVDWSAGDYRLTARGGRVESAVGSGVEKKAMRMIVEGSVLAAATDPVGAAIDVAPDGFAHPVYRSGFALTLKLPAVGLSSESQAEETTPEEEPLETRSGAEAPETASPEASAPEPNASSGEETRQEDEGSSDEL